MKVNISSSSLIACICEGGAETAIMDILLDNDLLIFKREQLLEESVLPRTSVKEYNRVHKQKNNEASLYDLLKTK